MDRTSIIVIVICFVLLGVWTFVLSPKLTKPLPPRPGTNNVALNATNAGTVTTSTGAIPAQAYVAATNAEALAHEEAKLTAATNVPEQIIVLSNAQAVYNFTTRGGGLQSVELLEFAERIPRRTERNAVSHRPATLNVGSKVPAMAILGGAAIEGDGNFEARSTADSVVFSKRLSNGLIMTKEFRLSTNYLVSLNVRMENSSTQALELPAQDWTIGTATPLSGRDTGQAVGVMWYSGSGSPDDVGTSYFSPGGLSCIMQRQPPTEYRGGASNVVWATAHNQFFALAAMPSQPASSVVIRKVSLPRPVGEEAEFVATNALPPAGYEGALVYPPLTLGPGQHADRTVFVYAGPKKYQTLAKIGAAFNNNLDALMNFGWFGFVSKALLLGMNAMHQAFRLSYGWAIILITVIIKTVFWPLTQASTRSMKRMQQLQPQMNAIREKYKDDPAKVNRKMMEFMKEHRVNPAGGCLPMLLQIPVFFGFYRMIQSAIELRGEHFLWVNDLSKSDTLFLIPALGSVPFIGIPGVGLPFNLLPLIMGATMLWQARLAPPSPGMDPAQAAIMRYMPLIFMVFLYNFSAGLTLYWTVQNLLTIIQTKLTRTNDPAGPPKPAAPALTPRLKGVK